MSDQPIQIPLQATLEGMSQVTSELENLKKLVAGIADSDPSGKIKQQVLGTQTSMEALAKSLSGVFGTVGAAMDQAAKQGTASAVSTVKEAVAEVQANYEKIAALGQVKLGALENLKTMGAQLFPEDRMRVKSSDLMAKSATKVSEDDVRNLLGMPSRDEMKTFASSIKSQMVDAVAQEKSTDRLRARSATPFTIDDFRALNGLPSRDESKSFAAQLKAGMLEDQAGYKSVEQEEAQKARWRAQSSSRFSVDDFRALNGLPSRDESKSFAAQLKAQMEAEQAATTNTEKLRARSATKYSIDDYRNLIGLPSEEQSKSMSAQIKAQMEADAQNTLAGIRRQVALASARPVGAFGISEGPNTGRLVSEEAAAQITLNNSQAEGVKSSSALRAEKAKLSDEMRNMHSAARGLASGFGAMWLTWGNVLPLMAGAGISGAVANMIKSGSEVQQQLTAMRVLGGESAESVSALNTQMLEMAKNGPYGPKETAAAMKTLVLAGMDAKDVAVSLKDVLNFSVAGDTGIQQAADTLTTVATAFGLGKGGGGMAGAFTYVSDIISVAAAESKASVEDMSNSFKTASAINQQFGVSLEDTAVGLALLANAGIRGTAAGTSLRNMVSDLSGRTRKATEAMKELGVEAIDPATGKIKSLDVVMGSLMTKLQEKSSPAGAMKYLQTIFDERGAKEAFAIFDALQTKAKVTQVGIEDAYAELKDKVVNAAGFSAIAAAEMALTPMNEMKSVAATLQGTLVEVFDTMKPYLIETAERLKEIFASDKFKAGLQDLIAGVGSLVTTLIEHGKAILTVIAGYAALKGVSTIVLELRAAYMAVTLAAEGAAAATGALGIATRLATAGNPLLLALTAAITAAAGGFMLYEMYMGQSTKATEDSEAPRKAMLKSLESERDRLREINLAREQGITVEELRARKTSTDDTDPALMKAKARLDKARLAKMDDDGLSELSDAQSSYDKLLVKANGDKQALIRAQYQVRAEAGKIADAQREEQRARLEESAKRFKGASNGPADTGGSSHTFSTLSDNTLASIKKQYDTEMSVVNEQESAKQRTLNEFRSANLIKAGQFYAQELALAESSEARKSELTDAARQKYADQLVAQIDSMQAAFDKWKKTPNKEGSLPSADDIAKGADKLQQDLQNLGNTAGTVLAQFAAADQKAEDTKLARMQIQAIKLAAELHKVADETKAFDRAEAESAAKKARAASVEKKLLYADPREAAVIAASANEFERINDTVTAQSRIIDDLNESLTDNENILANQAELSDKERSAIESVDTSLRTQIALRTKRKETLQATADSSARKAGDDAGTRYDEQLKAEAKWQVGAVKSLREYERNANNVAKNTGDVFAKAFKGMEDNLVKFVKTGELNFGHLAESIIDDMVRIAIQQSITGPLATSMLSLFANGGAFGDAGIQKFANGGTFTNQIVNSPTLFKFASGTGMMGEAGPEAIMPLTRGPNGKLGVQASGNGGGNSMVVNIIESSEKGGKVERRTEDGVDVLDVFVEKVKSSIASDINRGSGAVPGALNRTYGLNRAAGAY